MDIDNDDDNSGGGGGLVHIQTLLNSSFVSRLCENIFTFTFFLFHFLYNDDYQLFLNSKEVENIFFNLKF